METRQDYRTVEQLVDLRKNGFMVPNPEYQRGEVWTRAQEKKLIDSVLRGYQLPIIYLHEITTTIAGMTQERLEIIDGQQRTSALRNFVEGAFPLFNIGDEDAKFPPFLQNYECPWGGKYFDGLSHKLQTKLLETKLPVAFIKTDDSNEVRDLFVRLQSGRPLNAQEKRDSYPGQFTEFILKLGGKPAITRFPGHDFFQKVLKMKPGQDNGKTRQLAAQIAILFLERRKQKSDHLSDITASVIDDYYHAHLDFDQGAQECERLRKIFDLLTDKLSSWNGPKLQGHNAIHLVLFLDSIWDDYTNSWEDNLADAQKQFSKALADATLANRRGYPEEVWLNYGQWARTSADRGDSIRRRHRYYSARMMEFLGNLTPKDPTRAFNLLEREVIYWRDGGKCQVESCGDPVKWSEAEIHHVVEHQHGGKTVLENGVLVHKRCHPKGASALEFAKRYQTANPK